MVGCPAGIVGSGCLAPGSPLVAQGLGAAEILEVANWLEIREPFGARVPTPRPSQTISDSFGTRDPFSYRLSH